MPALARTTTIRTAATLVALLALLGALLAPTTPARAAPGDDGEAIRDGLADYVTALAGVAGVDELGEALPFTNVTPSGIADLGPSLVDLASALPAGSPTVAELDDALNTGISTDVGGITTTLSGDISDTAPYEVTVDLEVAGGGTTDVQLVTEELSLLTNGDAGEAGEDARLSTSVSLTDSLAFTLEDGELTLAPDAPAQLDASASATLEDGDFDANLGVLDAAVTGTLSADAHLTIETLDLDGSGTIESDEWTFGAPYDLFDVAWDDTESSPVVADLQLAAKDVPGLDVAGLDGATNATVTASGDLSDGVPDVDVDLGDLDAFRNLTPADLVAAIAQVAAGLRGVQNPSFGDLPLPLLDGSLADVVRVHRPLLQFFVDIDMATEDVLDVDDPTPLELDLRPEAEDGDAANLPQVDTIQELLPALRDAVGMDDSQLASAFDPDAQELTFDLVYDGPAEHGTVGFDVSQQLRQVGLQGVEAGPAASIELDPAFTVDVGVGIDLAAPSGDDPTPLLDRVFVDTAGTELTASAPVEAELDLTGQVGFLEVGLTGSDADGGPVTLLAPAGGASDMLTVDLAGTDGRLTLQQLFDGLSSDTAPGTATVDAEVPPFDLTVDADVSGSSVGTAGLDVSWPDVTDPSTLSVVPDTSVGNYEELFLPFAFDPEDPAALLGQLLDALDQVARNLQDAVGDRDALTDDLPLVGRSVDDLLTQVQAVRDEVDTLIDDPSSSLQELETQLEDVLADAASAAGADASDADFVDFEVSTSSPAVVTMHLSYGLCDDTSTPGDADGADCDVLAPLDVPVNLPFDLAGGGATAGLVGVDGGGEVGLDYSAIATLDLGVELPEVDTGGFDGDGLPEPPSASGAPELFVVDTTGVDVDAVLQADTTFEANVGPVTATIGQPAGVDDAETGPDCDNDVDDDGDGLVNDGCPEVGDDDESGDECDNATDDDHDDDPETDDEDGVVNDGCPAESTDMGAAIGAALGLGGDGDGDRLAPADLAGELDVSVDGIEQSCPGGASGVDGCATLPVFVEGSWIGTITLEVPQLEDPGTWDLQVPSDLFDNLADQLEDILDWATIIEGLGQVIGLVGDTLSATSYDVQLPVVGDALDAGQDVAGELQLVRDTLDGVADDLEGAATFGALESTLQDELFDVLDDGDDGILLDTDDDGDVDSDDIVVVGDCGGSCGDDTPLSSVESLEVRIALGQEATTTEPFAFDLGLPGLRLAMDEDLEADAGWRVDLAFGVSQEDGFYLRTDNPIRSGEPEVGASATVDLPDEIGGDIALLRIAATDTNDGDDLDLSVDGDLTGGGGRIGLSQLSSSVDPAGFDVTIDGGAHVNLELATSAEVPDVDTPEGALPTVRGDFNLDWDWSSDDLADLEPPEVTFENLRLDLGSFVDDFLGPIASEIRRLTSPIMPVVDVISAPIPGISDLAELVGAEPVTMLTLFKATQGEGSVELVDRVIGVINLADAIVGAADAGEVPLGGFDLDVDTATAGPLAPGERDQLIEDFEDVTSETPNAFAELSDGTKDAIDDAGGFTFPAFEDTTQLFTMLVGQDVTLVRWDAGTLKSGFGFSQTFGPIALGPVPVSVIISGSAGIEGRFAVGYDTAGIRQFVEHVDENEDAPGTGESLGMVLYGVFIDDLDAQGRDVPEVRLRAEFSAGAAVDAVIVKVGVEGGVGANLDFNLADGGRPSDDPPFPVDGKIRYDELIAQLHNPICLFNISGSIDAFLRAFVKLGVGPFSKKFSKTIVEVVLLELDKLESDLCDNPPEPKLAEVDGGDDVLLLNMGTSARRSARAFPPDTSSDSAINEHFTVRQLDRDGTRFAVSAYGYHQVFEHEDPLSVFAYGAGGDDSVAIEVSGIEATETGDGTTFELAPDDVVEFTAPVTLCGGPGADDLGGGAGGDTLVGDGRANFDDDIDGGDDYTCDTAEHDDDGEDAIAGGAGVDTVFGGGAIDTISGDGGGDVLHGGSGADEVAGGFGPDEIHGGDGADTLIGGPDIDPDADPDDAWEVADVSDTIFGDAGADSVEGGFGEDELHGGDGPDAISGGPHDDQLFGDGDHDLLSGDDGADTAHGGPGDDDVLGGTGSDELFGDAGNDDLVGGDDDTPAGADAGEGGDTLEGGTGRDVLLGDLGTIDRPAETPLEGDATVDQQVAGMVTFEPGGDGHDTLRGGGDGDFAFGQGGDDHLLGQAGADLLRGSDGDDHIEGGDGADRIFGDDGEDLVSGDGDDDTARGGRDDDEVHGDAGDDTLFGDSGDDVLTGDGDDDTLRGGPGDDVLEGNANGDGVDVLHGDGGDDRLVGGSSDSGDAPDSDGDTDDGTDHLFGGQGRDVLAGDNADQPVSVLTDPSPEVTLLNRDTIGAADVLSGDAGHDALFGGLGDDELSGGDGNDHLAGNDGADTAHGDGGHDVVVGGSAQAGAPDTGDTLLAGDAGRDVVTGDNASVVMAAFGTVFAPPERTIALHDVPFLGSADDDPATMADVSGDDTITGGGDDDVLYGQSGDDDVAGGAGDDYAEGNAGADDITGGDGQDDLVGGSGHDDGGPDGAFRQLREVVDEAVDPDGGGPADPRGDAMEGGDGSDYLTGDNANVVRVALPVDRFDPDAAPRSVELYDVLLVGSDTSSLARASGPDVLHGDGGTDVLFGQGSADTVHGGSGDDYLEGNHAGDVLAGDAGQDDVVGGGSAADGVFLPAAVTADGEFDDSLGSAPGDGLLDGSDVIFGESDTSHGDTDGDGGDVIAGDNARINRPLTDDDAWDVNTFNDTVIRHVVLFDVETVDGPAVDPSVHGSDTIWGNDNDDRIWGQGAGDALHGGAGDDAIEGNHASDTIFGDGDQDDLVGGSSAAGRLDTGDLVFGGTDEDGGDSVGDDRHDVVAGDNARIERPLDDAGAWVVLTPPDGDDTDPRARVERDVTMLDDAPGATSGSDLLRGNAGDDDLYGQYDDSGDDAPSVPYASREVCYGSALAGDVGLTGDLACGDDGEDAILGDQGVVTNLFETGDRAAHIEPQQPFIEDDIFPRGQLTREVVLDEPFDVGGADAVLGGDDGDWLHGGGGPDLLNGNAGEDRVFGDDGDDALWGGTEHDHGYGGYGADALDVQPRDDDPDAWFAVAPEDDSYHGADHLYGGWDRDALQADVGGPGPNEGDRLLDWSGAYNVYYVCPGAYGEYTITRSPAPGIEQYLIDQATGDGAIDVATPGSSGFDELGLVYRSDIRDNTGQPHPDHPGHFTCVD